MTNPNGAHEAPHPYTPDRAIPPNPADEPLASPRRGLMQVARDFMGNILPGRSEQDVITPISEITNGKIAGLFKGVDPRTAEGVQPKMSIRVVLRALGWKDGASGYADAETTARGVLSHLESAAAIRGEVQKDMVYFEPWSQESLQRFIDEDQARTGESWTNQRDTAAGASRVDKALGEHAAKLEPRLQPRTPIPGTK